MTNLKSEHENTIKCMYYDEKYQQPIDQFLKEKKMKSAKITSELADELGIEKKENDSILVERDSEKSGRGYHFLVGFYDDGNGKNKIDRSLPGYNSWHGMLDRCYGTDSHKLKRTYTECNVCKEWLNLYNFNEWYVNNYYSIPGEKMELDKDILVRGNKIYSPETCVFVPKRINLLILKSERKRGEFPIGVYYDRGKKKYVASLSYEGKSLKIKRCDLPIEAFFWYKWYKEAYIKQVADEYKDKIPEKLYKALYDWKIEITD